MSQSTSKSHPAQSRLSDGALAEVERVDWGELVPFVVHPTKVQIIEAMQWIDRAMSAVELEKVFGETLSVGNISYHLKTLRRIGPLTMVGARRVRGAWEYFYYFTEVR